MNLLDPEAIHILSTARHGAPADQAWHHLGDENYLIHSRDAQAPATEIVIRVVGVLEADRSEPFVLLLG